MQAQITANYKKLERNLSKYSTKLVYVNTFIQNIGKK